jgi:hypothetical protein
MVSRSGTVACLASLLWHAFTKDRGGMMLGRHIYRVSSPSDGKWVVAKEGEERVLGARPTRDAAAELAYKLAAADQPSKVVIENPEGTLEDERAFGDDPGMKVLD